MPTEMWQVHEKHATDLWELFARLGFLIPGTHKIVRWHGKEAYEEMGKLGHDSVGFNECKCKYNHEHKHKSSNGVLFSEDYILKYAKEIQKKRAYEKAHLYDGAYH